MRWLTNLRLAGDEPACDEAEGRRHVGCWRVGVDGDGLIARVRPMPPGSRAAGEDWGGDWLSPGGVDLQINGGLGLAFPELTHGDLPRLHALLQLLWRDGVEAICPTLVTCAPQALRQALAVLAEARRRHRPGHCRLLGAHLEGPFLAPERRGAHPAQHLQVPSRAALDALIAGFQGGAEADVALMTLAPELEGASEVIDDLQAAGVVVSLGHSGANEEQARQSFGRGVGMLTHSFNAMAGLHHRAPGPVAAALLKGEVALGLIADGVHVAPTMAVLLQRLAPRQLVIVSDALAPYGLADGTHRWDERLLLVQDGSCRLEDGTLAGVTLPLLEGVRRLAGWSGLVPASIAAATLAPRRLLGERRPLELLLLGMPLGDTLRWSTADGSLRWRRPDTAAGEPQGVPLAPTP
ncbi:MULTISPECIES: N-acetylglucosamine-6-phosphate deacetylase [unclassified Cyanobium]|uniref:N-acetylglucosamine-6-phosphate deacetylase n=1 Tax=unclassified Cyanobium TaxID=2627006 RepID=UPI0020CF715D|nr:N-acetylglucosamine-6-phosphate deacetylase [Cyanobium sp. La Preciosa 7G6]MCP9833868.1 N-acetylglucosamine-6-phosphate deacetylase [Cyanobium sp. La Preciosa 7G6]MCP9936632.1 N-acetylglucosamine-6-phosphate deacetylase [Cyanobium sp. Aljojuca 7A6]